MTNSEKAKKMLSAAKKVSEEYRAEGDELTAGQLWVAMSDLDERRLAMLHDIIVNA